MWAGAPFSLSAIELQFGPAVPDHETKMRRRFSGILLAGLITLAPLRAATDDNAHAWFMYFGDHAIGKSKWGAHLEGQWRRADMGIHWQQLLLRPGVNYQVNSKLMLTAGYGFVETYRYGGFPVPAAFPEHRFFEQALITPRAFKLDWQNRLRLEQRNLGVMVQQPNGGFRREAWRYENRFRYMLRTNVPLRVGGGKYYIGLYNEIFFNFGKNVAANVFDQNRAYIALGRNMGRETRFEIGFMEQTLQQRSGQVFEHNHTLQVSITSRLPFGD